MRTVHDRDTVIRQAAAADLEATRDLLRAADLPVDGLEDRFGPAYAVAEARPAGALLGAAGVESYGAYGLLRSVVVVPGRRGTGLGRALVTDRLEWARAAGLTAVYLLTTTAPDFFAALGFARVARGDVPAEVRASREFASVCPASSVVMRMGLRPVVRGGGER